MTTTPDDARNTLPPDISAHDAVVADMAEDDAHLGLADTVIREVSTLLEEGALDAVRALCSDMEATDMAELLTKSGTEQRRQLVDILGDLIDPEAFSYIDQDIRYDLFDTMPAPRIATIVNGLESDDAISLINDLDDDRQHEIMRHLSRRVRAAIEEGLTFDEDSAGRLMQREFVAVPQFWTIGKSVDYLRAAADNLPPSFYDLFIVDQGHRFVGSVPLSRVLCAQRSVRVETLAGEDQLTIPVDMDREQVAHLFRRKDLLSAPVVDNDDKLIGMITVDDIVDVIDEEAEEDIMKLGGVSDSDIYRTTLATARARSTWLAVNLLTAFVAAAVIGQFEHTISKVVALAVLMPIVAGMGGNAGTQTMTVVIRALATKELSRSNTWRMVGKEFAVGSINGSIFAILVGSVVWWWFGQPHLAGVIAAAMVINLTVAGLAGILIPVALDRLNIDPAPSAGVFLTTVTDVTGFLAFLGLATLLLL